MPDFRNLGVIARILVGAHLAAGAAAIAGSPDLASAAASFLQDAAVLEPLLLACIVVLYGAAPWLSRIAYWGAACAVVAAACALAVLAQWALAAVGGWQAPAWPRTVALAALASAGLLAYFRLHARAFSPALVEARLQALQARIRPHFLFNSLNAVLSLIRRDPKRAERALEDLADLFRTLMSDARQFVRLADEIALLERYASLEQLRLGERLRITWELDDAPPDALLPPLVLQPLLENAVYHGVEPSTGAGEVRVRIELRGARVLARIENPFDPRLEAAPQREGNRMALDNIRERLALFFDAEARIQTSAAEGRYLVEIEIPYRTIPA